MLLQKLLGSGLVLILLFVVLVFLFQCMIIVGDGKMAVLIKKTGKTWNDKIGQSGLLVSPIIAPSEEYKGIQPKPLGEGWHFRNPYTWDHEIHPQTQIAEGSMGVLIRLSGKPLDYEKSQVIGEQDQIGIVREVLKPGNYLLNPYEYTVEIHPAIKVPDGHRGVVTLMAGKMPKNPNAFLVEKNERGVSRETLPPGTYYENPYEKLITPVDLRSHRFDMSDKEKISFPSFDGFFITMEGNIEWRIDSTRVAEVYMKYKDERDLIPCIVEKTIMPNARALIRIDGSKHPAKDFIAGETREKLQEQFYSGLKVVCEKEGIQIMSARIARCTPPDEICNPIQAREIAIREREKYSQECDREKEQIVLQMETARRDFEVRKTKAETEVSVSKMNAMREKEVAIIQQQQQLEVAKKRLEAAKNEAAAILARATAEADVVRMQNKAEATAILDARTAFGTGKEYANFLILEKVASSIEYILANTDSPFLEVFRQMQNTLQAHAKSDKDNKGEQK
jgi:regulator of protease activity HflC (stomatin/prohibitin superfamily)